MCQNQNPFHEIPLQFYLLTMCQSIRQVKDNIGHCKGFLPKQDHQFIADFLSVEQTSAQLQSQLEQIMINLNVREELVRSQPTMLTFFDNKNKMPIR